MAQKKKTSEARETAYSFSEYLEKFRPNPLPEPPRIDPDDDAIASQIIAKALKKIRKRSGSTVSARP